MKGRLRVTLHLFGHKVTISTSTCLGSDSSPAELKRVADVLREELSSQNFPWERLLEGLEPEEAWSEAIEKLL